MFFYSFLIIFGVCLTRGQDSWKISQQASGENGKNLFLSGTKKIEKHFLIFFPDKYSVTKVKKVQKIFKIFQKKIHISISESIQ